MIAPDLLGHGESDKPRNDSSIAAYANGLRDLLSVLGIDRATVVGHSLGGGVAMQFTYQFPEFVERLVLVGTGGVTADVSIALRLASLPMVGEALAALRLPGVQPALRLAGRVVRPTAGSTSVGRDLPNVLRLLVDISEPAACAAFSRTVRSSIHWRGQMITMLDRAYLAEPVPVQLIWGEQDSVIPVTHARLAHAAMRGSRLTIFEGSGHFRSMMIRTGSSKWWSVSSIPPRPAPMTESCCGACYAPGRPNMPPPDRSTPRLRHKTSPNRVPPTRRRIR